MAGKVPKVGSRSGINSRWQVSLGGIGNRVRRAFCVRQRSLETMGLASRASSTSDKSRLLALAEAWLDLADRAQRVASHHKRKVRELRSLVSTISGQPADTE
jgi:hypothetical protein